MKHIALVCPELSGHLNPMTTLGAELRRRGHAVTLIGKEDGRTKAETAGLGFCPIGREEFPGGAMAAFSAELGLRTGHQAVRFTLEHFLEAARVVLRETPEVLRAEKIDGLLVDQTTSSAGSVAEAAGIPYVSVANALPINQDPLVPPVVTSWACHDTWWARARNRLGYAVLRRMIGPIDRAVNEFRIGHGLPPLRRLNDRYSRLGQIAQQPPCFDFPREGLPETFHYTGPFHRRGEARDDVDFPWERLDGRPLVYASMGTLQNRLDWVFEVIAEACAPLDVQLVMSLGGSSTSLPEDLPGRPLVVPYAPQLRLIDRATLVISHGGLNTALESLACGVPMVAIPVTNDQPGVAARLRWTGAGEFVALKSLDAGRLHTAVRRVLDNGTYRAAAQRLRDEIAATDGVGEAADIVERVMG
jgi:MGT family glycosyltransferase